MKANNRYLRVHFEIESSKSTDIILPLNQYQRNEIPCQSVVLNNPNTQVYY